jgi:hypothetical protein
MKVFVSWSGDRSKAVASAIKYWLPYVFQGLDVWMSEQNIQAGAKWGAELGKALGQCKLGIICLTHESLQSRWLTFEAGALSTAIDESRVIPYRFQLSSSDISPPLSQFQDVGADEEGTFKLVQSINDALGKPWPEEEKLQLVFKMWWPRLEDQLTKMKHSVPTQIRTDRDLLEEILDLSRQTGIRDLNAVLWQLLAAPNVRRVEVAPKQVAGTITNSLALRITVAKKLPLAQIPREQLIPSSIFGMLTDVIEGE